MIATRETEMETIQEMETVKEKEMRAGFGFSSQQHGDRRVIYGDLPVNEGSPLCVRCIVHVKVNLGKYRHRGGVASDCPFWRPFLGVELLFYCL